jgi:hypothetical protein
VQEFIPLYSIVSASKAETSDFHSIHGRIIILGVRDHHGPFSERAFAFKVVPQEIQHGLESSAKVEGFLA